MRHPGRNAEMKGQAAFDREFARAQRFDDGYTAPFHAKHGIEGGPHNAGYLLEMIGDMAFDMSAGVLRPASKRAAFLEFTEKVDDDFNDRSVAMRTLTEADAEAALAFLQAEGMVEVTGDEIRVPARFWPPS